MFTTKSCYSLLYSLTYCALIAKRQQYVKFLGL